MQSRRGRRALTRAVLFRARGGALRRDFLPPRALAGCLVCMLLAGGCELAVPSDLPPFACSGTDPSACPSGQYCSSSSCVPCDALHCPGLDAGADVTMHESGPDAPTPHDGSDAPVDGVLPDVGPDVPPPPDTSCGGAIGCPCTTKADCLSGICGDSTVLTSAIASIHGSVCTTPCCTTAGCPSGYVCFGPGNAGNYCVLSTDLNRPTLGMATAGQPCTLDANCRSGKCDVANGRCIDTCCSDVDCAAPTVCSFDTALLDGHAVFACLTKTGAGAHAACTLSSDCTSNDCESNTCRPHCCGTASCLGSGFHACELDVGTDDTNVCRFPSSDPTGTAFGGACTAYDQCVTRACDPAAGKCTEFCCTDADCASHPGYVCRPAQTTPLRYLICMTP